MESNDRDEAELIKCAGISEQNFGKTEELNCSSLPQQAHSHYIKVVRMFAERRDNVSFTSYGNVF